MQIDYKSASIHYEIMGAENDPLVLLHGFMESSKIWKYIVKELQKSRQVICIDLPGHGKSEGFSDVHTMNEMAEIVRLILLENEIQQVSIAGHSMGGYVGLEFLKKFPKMLTSIVLINSTPFADDVEKKQNRDRAVKLVTQNKDAFVRMSISNLFAPEMKEKIGDEIEDMIAEAKKLSVKNIIANIEGMKIRTNSAKQFSGFSGKKTLVCGMEDPLLDFNQLGQFSWSWGCEFKLLNYGHVSMIEEPEDLTTIMHFID